MDIRRMRYEENLKRIKFFFEDDYKDEITDEDVLILLAESFMIRYGKQVNEYYESRENN